eukprot:FR740141.1.p3 GENE.FR740141.1~~FR740141.1.p3  ORF type:complete len:116 (+),score=16.14 FR740141.1:241-588(+)
MCSIVKAEMSQIILRCIFSDGQVLEALAVAKVFEGIEGKPPSGLLLMLKKKLGSHMKSRSFFYKKEINAEIAHIQRIQALQARAVTLTGTLIMSVFIGLANFTSTYTYDQYYGAD